MKPGIISLHYTFLLLLNSFKEIYWMIINLDFLSDYMEDNVSYRKEKDYIYTTIFK